MIYAWPRFDGSSGPAFDIGARKWHLKNGFNFWQPAYGCGSKPRVVAGPALPLCYKPFSRPAVSNPLSHSSRGYDSTYYLKGALCWGPVAEGFVAEQPHLLQPYVAKWLPKPVTNPMFLIPCHVYIHVILASRNSYTRRNRIKTLADSSSSLWRSMPCLASPLQIF